MDEELSREEFLNKKRDFSSLLVHLTRDDDIFHAKDVLDMILDGKTLKAFNHFCLFSPSLKESNNNPLQDKFKVVCFTETPIDQVDVLLNKVSGRNLNPDSYGLVFKKEYIREKGGNPVFYVTKEIAKPLWDLYRPLSTGNAPQDSEEKDLCRLLALVTVCEKGNDWHWERECRIVDNLQFELNDVYCGLCPEADITYFENRYEPVVFISPSWGINKILDKLVGK